MVSEARRGVIRLLANYSQVFANVILGLWLVRLMLRSMGDEAFGLIGLLGATVGIAGLAQEITQRSMIRELGAAYHHQDPKVFRSTYNAALALSAAAAGVVLVVFGILLLVLPFFSMSQAMLPATRWFIVFRACQAFFTVALAPPSNMYLVTERMVLANTWGVLDTVGRVVGAWVVLITGVAPEQGLILYAGLSTAWSVLLKIIMVVLMVCIDRRLVPAFSTISRDAIKSLLRIGGWNTMVITASSLQLRSDALIMNILLGADFGSAIWHLGTRLTSYVRRLAVAAARGTDAVAARLSTIGRPKQVRKLLYHSTRIHGFVIFPATFALILLAEPCVRIWVGRVLGDPDRLVPAATSLVRVLAVGMACRSLSAGWFRIFYGAGHIHTYAPWVLVGGIANPILAIILFFVLPQGYRHTAAAWAYMVAFAVFNVCLASSRGAAAMGLSFVQLLRPLLRPLVVAIVCLPLLLLFVWRVQQWNALWLAAAVLPYSGVYFGLSLVFVLQQHERERFGRALLRQLGRRPPQDRQGPNDIGSGDFD